MTMPAGSIDASDPFSMWTKVDHDEIWRGGWNETTYMIWRGERNMGIVSQKFLFVSTLQTHAHDIHSLAYRPRENRRLVVQYKL